MLRLVLQKGVLRLVVQTEDMDYLLELRIYLRLIGRPLQLEGVLRLVLQTFRRSIHENGSGDVLILGSLSVHSGLFLQADIIRV